MAHPLGTQPGYRQTPLSAEEKACGEANFAPIVAGMLVAGGRFRVSADTPDQVELFQGVARRVSDMLQRPVASYANGREILITFGQEQAPALALRSPGRASPQVVRLTGGRVTDVRRFFRGCVLRFVRCAHRSPRPSPRRPVRGCAGRLG
jgi:hypothetical protein